ncbi:MAG TPA: regulatory protein RecX [Dermatophilaceae bacterium]|nr:regulatory protein RecX [Dermatophilaceae bacterium]
MTTLDKAASEVAALTLVRGTSKAGDPVPDVSRTDREPDPHQVARQIVLRQLAMAPRSRAELMQKLEQRDCPAEVVETVLDRMTEVGLIDDQAYAQMLVRSQQSGRGLAKRALARELRTKGIENHLAEQALATITDEDERDRARALVDKRLRAMHGLGIDVQTRRLAGMLARKGYTSSVTYAVIREAIADAPEHLHD